jgi:N-acetylmuramoyl-L-alanine amidase
LQLDIYGGVSQVNFFQYGKLDPLIQRAIWSQPRDSVFRVNVDLNQPVWGYDVFHDGNNALVLRIRRPPRIDAANPLRGLRVLVDPGHGGHDTTTTGPTGFREAHANLNISLALKPLLEAAGAHVIMTRTTNVFLELGDRTKMATDSNAHILVSVHNNAFPEGVNPFVSNGTSSYYYHPHSVDMAQSLQRHLLAELGLRDIGYGRADLAMVRPTWMPAVLTETSFMMIPEQEAALRNPQWLNRVARAHVRGLEEFLRKRAAEARQ